MLTMKFGGTSLQDASAFRQVGQIISKKEKAVIVLSAMAGVTDALTSIIENIASGNYFQASFVIEEIKNKHKETLKELNLTEESSLEIDHKCQEISDIIKASEILGEITPKSTAIILSLGERLSSCLANEYFISIGLKSKLIHSSEIIKTENKFISAQVILDDSYYRIKSKVEQLEQHYDFIVCAGFIGSNQNNQITTIGRGGSDYSAAIIANAINSKMLEIWTDVDGILTCDPRVIENPYLVSTLSYAEAAELSFFGAKVLHPKTIRPAIEKNIPVKVLNTFNPETNGTIICSNNTKETVKSLAFKRNITVINIVSNRMLGAYGFLHKVFEVFDKNHCSVDLVTTSEVSISLTLDEDSKLDQVKEELSTFAEVDIWKNMSIISIVGEGIRATSGIAARFFGILEGINISMVSIGASAINLGIVVKDDDVINAVRLIHKEFFTDLKDNLFINMEKVNA